MPFELFERKRTHGGPPAVTISKMGMFVINSSAIEKYFQNRKYASIYWDKESGKVGLKPQAKKEATPWQACPPIATGPPCC